MVDKILFSNPVPPFRVKTSYGRKGVWWGWSIRDDGKWRKGKVDGFGNHTGYDFPCPIGTKCYAVAEGKVIYINIDPKHKIGNFLILKTKNYNITYAHLSLIESKEGDKVKQNDLLALSGKTGNVTGPHLHISFRDSSGQWFPVNWPDDVFSTNTK